MLTCDTPVNGMLSTHTWIAFAASSDPGWRRYDLSRRVTMRCDAAARLVDDPLAGERALWEGQRA
jgi:carboxylesterase type B